MFQVIFIFSFAILARTASGTPRSADTPNTRSREEILAIVCNLTHRSLRRVDTTTRTPHRKSPNWRRLFVVAGCSCFWERSPGAAQEQPQAASSSQEQSRSSQEKPRSSPGEGEGHPGAARSRPGAAQEQPGAAQAQPGAAQEQPRRSPEATFDVFLAGRGGPKSEEASFGINFHQKSGPAIHRDLLKKCFFEQFLRHSGPPPRRLPSTCFWPEGGAQK